MLLEDISAAFSGDRLKTEEPWRHGGCLMHAEGDTEWVALGW